MPSDLPAETLTIEFNDAIGRVLGTDEVDAKEIAIACAALITGYISQVKNPERDELLAFLIRSILGARKESALN